MRRARPRPVIGMCDILWLTRAAHAGRFARFTTYANRSALRDGIQGRPLSD